MTARKMIAINLMKGARVKKKIRHIHLETTLLLLRDYIKRIWTPITLQISLSFHSLCDMQAFTLTFFTYIIFSTFESHNGFNPFSLIKTAKAC